MLVKDVIQELAKHDAEAEIVVGQWDGRKVNQYDFGLIQTMPHVKNPPKVMIAICDLPMK